MPELLTMQDLANGHLDVKALGEAANGDENTIVTARTGETYPSAKKAIKTMFENGGFPATPFETKAKMETEGAILADGKLAQVYNETSNNGLYVKTAGVWVKSAYDVASKNYLANELAKIAEIQDGANIVEIRDAVNKLVLYMRANGDLHLPLLDKSLQQTLNDINLKISNNESLVGTSLGRTLFDFRDLNGEFVGGVSQSGELLFNDVVTANGSVDKRLDDLSKNTNGSSLGGADYLKQSDKIMAARDRKPFKNEVNLATLASLGVDSISVPSGTRVERNKIFCTINAGADGDFGSPDKISKSLSFWVTIEDDYSLTVGEFNTVLLGGVDDFGSYGYGGGVPLYVNKGAHAGRIYIYYLKRYGMDKDVMCHVFSDDLGVTWSPVVDMTPFIPLAEEWRVTLASPAKMLQIQSGAYEGRIVLPCWRGDINYPASQAGLKSFIMYSDDGGETYTIGAESANIGSNECAIAEIADDGLMLLTRNASRYKHTEVSYDGGETLTNLRILNDVVTTKVQSGFVQAKNRFDLSVEKLIISTPMSAEGTRDDLGIYISYDNENFDLVKQISTGEATYSYVEVIDESHLLVIYSGYRFRTLQAIVVNLKEILTGE